MKLFVVTNILIIIGSYLFIAIIGHNINDKFLDYSLIEASRITKYIVNNVVNSTVLNRVDMNNLFITDRGSNNEIKYMNFNIKEVNILLGEVTNNILIMFKEFESGNSSIVDLSNNFLTNTPIKGYKNGVIIEVPIGIATDNFILANIGPKIPIKLSLTGELESSISTSIVNYGINSALVTVYLDLNVSLRVLLPFKTEKITVNHNIPIAMSFIDGKLPSYYMSGWNASTGVYTIPKE